jgi:hypothetical protein
MALDFFADVFDFGGSVVKTVGDFFDTTSSTLTDIGTGLFSIFDNDSVWGSVSGMAGELLLEGSSTLAMIEAADAALASGETAAEVFFANSDLLYDESIRVEGRTNQAVVNARLKGTRLLSSQIVRYNKAGVTMEGSPLLVLEETKDLIDIEINSIYEEGIAAAERLRALGDIEDIKAENAMDEAEFKAQTITVEGIKSSLTRLLGIK